MNCSFHPLRCTVVASNTAAEEVFNSLMNFMAILNQAVKVLIVRENRILFRKLLEQHMAAKFK